MGAEDEEKLHEYFTNRPIGFLIFFSVTLLITTVGVLGNVLLIYTKLRRFRHLNGLELLVINFAGAIITLSFIFLILITNEMFHELTDEGLCNTIWFLQGISQTSIAFSALSMIVASKYFSKISKQNAAKIIFVIWIAAILDAYPYFGFEVFPLELKNGKKRNVCHIAIDNYEDYFSFIRHHTLMLVVEFFLPALLLIITSFVAFLWKKPDTSTNKIIFNYSLMISIYFMVTNFPLVLNRYLSIRKIAQMNLDMRHVCRFFLSFIVLANPLMYGYFDDFLVKEISRIFYRNNSENFHYEHHDEKECEDV